ncbi:hypothetical protein FZI51_01435 [Cronobacter sakazakii]|nr:hypothetical protein FZI46_18405 [Cronobacter sakazakii]KAB1487851.1 hypothetical protein FZI51_01435 [Cronobacter sakazakii]KAB1501881.1 hypothetical protein FZH95_02295 [Cronobacter sakazakii]PPY32484.1 hypothetical protein C3D68_03185 [Cronobacter sakazakii]PRO57528.1 hypothetical protein C5938_04700 [Cronobacter sakazakii]
MVFYFSAPFPDIFPDIISRFLQICHRIITLILNVFSLSAHPEHHHTSLINSSISIYHVSVFPFCCYVLIAPHHGALYSLQ